MISDLSTVAKSSDYNSQLLNTQASSTSNTKDSQATIQQTENQNQSEVQLSSAIDRAYAVVKYEVSAALSMVFSSQSTPIDSQPTLTNDHATDTSENILNSVKNAVSAVESDQRNNLLELSSNGVDRGVAASREILSGQGVLTERVNYEISTVQEKIQVGISALASTDAVNIATSETALFASDTNTQQSADIQITTKDGDVIGISVNQSYTNSTQMLTTSDANGSTFAMSSAQNNNISYSFSVQGNLDEDERNALGEVISNISELSEKFFSGELTNVFEQMSEFKFNTQEFNSLSIDLAYSESVVAISAYQSIQTMSEVVTSDAAITSGDTPTINNSQLEPIAQSPIMNTAPGVSSVSAADPSQAVAEPTPAPIDNIAKETIRNPTSNVSNSPSVLMETNGSFESLVGYVRELVDNLNNLDLFGSSEAIAIDLFEGIVASNSYDITSSNTAVHQFQKILEYGSLEIDTDTNNNSNNDDDHDEDHDDDS